MKILVLYGGNSAERDISLQSGETVIKALCALKHEVTVYDLQKGLDGISQFSDSVDMVFPILHGEDGEDGTVQAQLEQLGLPYLGSDSAVSRLCFDKILFKKELIQHGITTPRWEEVTARTIARSPLLQAPYVLKPIASGSSIDTFIVRDPKNQPNFTKALTHHKHMLLEELIDGDEITVSILDGQALPVIEIIPPYNEEFDFINKYNGMTQENCPPKHVSKALQQKAQDLATKVYTAAGARHFARIDIIIDQQNILHTLELNTIPGLTTQSLFPKAAAAAGMSFEQVMQQFVKLVETN